MENIPDRSLCWADQYFHNITVTPAYIVVTRCWNIPETTRNEAPYHLPTHLHKDFMGGKVGVQTARIGCPIRKDEPSTAVGIVEFILYVCVSRHDEERGSAVRRS